MDLKQQYLPQAHLSSSSIQTKHYFDENKGEKLTGTKCVHAHRCDGSRLVCGSLSCIVFVPPIHICHQYSFIRMFDIAQYRFEYASISGKLYVINTFYILVNPNP